MPVKKLKGLYNELDKIVVNKKDEIIPVDELWSFYHKYVEYQNSKSGSNDGQNDSKILYFLLEKLYVTNCTDLDLVSAVIKRFQTERIWFHGITSDLFNRSKHFKTNDIIDLLEYCLTYAYKKKILFNGMRMATLSHFFQMTLQPRNHYNLSLPKIMVLLLRYGMLLNPIDGKTPSFDIFSISGYSDDLLPVIIKCHLDWRIIWHSIVIDGIILHNPKFLTVSELPDAHKEIVNMNIKVANTFMRESVKFKLTEFYFSMANQEYIEAHPINQDAWELMYFIPNRMRQFNRLDAINFIQRLGRFLPELPRRCLEIMSLKCICKQNIRKILHLNWQLPYGILKLDIPESLIRYLNLELD